MGLLAFGWAWSSRSGWGRMKYLVAVSGGIDSVVLLDMLIEDGQHELIVAHFDHGIRDDSADDARFVRGLAEQYGLPFTTVREELGQGASENLARDRRYAFLRDKAREYDAVVVTAHHADDIIETIAINLIRGTGWRGLAVMDTPGIVRPLLHLTKDDIRKYALAKRLEWVEDSTNADDQYLRNRLRRRITALLPDESQRAVLDLRLKQRELRAGIEKEIHLYVRTDRTYDRYFLTLIDSSTACEVLRNMIGAATFASPTRPQTERALLAVKTARSGAVFEIGTGVKLRFTERTFIVEAP